MANKRLLPLWWVTLSIGVVAADYFSGPQIEAPIAFVIPVVIASWYSGMGWGIGLSVAMVSVRSYYVVNLWIPPEPASVAAINAIIRLVVLSLLAILVRHTANKSHEVKVLRGLLPICAFCKRIRNPDNSWTPIEAYVSDHSDSRFSHTFCPDCSKEQYGIEIKES